MEKAGYSSVACLVGLLALGCTGRIEPPSGGGSAVPTPQGSAPRATGLRRLTAYELDNVLRDLLEDGTRPAGSLLPEDVAAPFDNDHRAQSPSAALVEGVELLATEASERLLSDPVRRDRVVGCVPRGADDAACFATFLRRFGRRAFRRPLVDAELARLGALLAWGEDAGDFYVAVDMALRVMLQSTELLYRVESGAPIGDGLLALDDFAVASRLSFLLWGSAPDDSLLDHAAAGDLLETSRRVEIARAMLEDPRALTQVQRFHAQWLGYAQISTESELGRAMREESDRLIARVVFDERRPYLDLLRSNETYVDGALAEIYGLPAPEGGGGWVRYRSPLRRGILSHATFLSNGGEVEQTLPIHRGLWVREQLLCDPIGSPPPDLPPIGDAREGGCKEEQLAMHATGGCAGCHRLTDPIGFGLDAFDQIGRFRTHEPDRPECAIRGDGELAEVGPFNGPGELGERMIESGRLRTCLVEQVVRWSLGHATLDGQDRALVAGVDARLGDDDFRLEDLLVAMIEADGFVQRRVLE